MLLIPNSSQYIRCGLRKLRKRLRKSLDLGEGRTISTANTFPGYAKASESPRRANWPRTCARCGRDTVPASVRDSGKTSGESCRSISAPCDGRAAFHLTGLGVRARIRWPPGEGASPSRGLGTTRWSGSCGLPGKRHKADKSRRGTQQRESSHGQPFLYLYFDRVHSKPIPGCSPL